MMKEWRKLPVLRDDRLLFEDTSVKPVPKTEVPCLICTKNFEMRTYSGDPDQVCPECWKTYRDCAILICGKCRVVICRLVPRKTESGYTIEPHTVLHTDKCNICAGPDIEKSMIVEITEWERYHRQPLIISNGGVVLSRPTSIHKL